MLKGTTIICIVLISASLLSGCFSSKTSLSTVRMDRPEVSENAYAVRARLGLAQRNEIILSEFATNLNEPATLDPQVDDANISPFSAIGLTIVPRLEVSLSGNDDVKISVKYQFSGDSADKATAGNFSQAVSLGYSRFEDDSPATSSSSSFIAISNPIDGIYTEFDEAYSQRTHAIDVAWILGYRVNSNFLIYGGPYFIHGDLSGDQTLTIREADNADFTNPSIAERVLQLDSNGYMLGANFALEYQFNVGFFLSAEASFNSVNWENDSSSQVNIALGLGYQF
ncbi:MAG: hypothetical protein ACJAVV_002139 [Alphaproteobacteria bacterium]|jgi:hypothetical protein